MRIVLSFSYDICHLFMKASDWFVQIYLQLYIQSYLNCLNTYITPNVGCYFRTFSYGQQIRASWLCFQRIQMRQIYLLMFNPQRKAKFVDILMEEKAFQRHLSKVNEIRSSASPTNQRLEEQRLQEKYLNRIYRSKQEVKKRHSSDLHRQNHRLFQKLIETDRRPDENPEIDTPQKHFNSYFNSRRESNRIRADNFGMISRMINQASVIPTLQEMKRDFKQNKRYAKMVRKLPSILKHQQQFRHDLSARRLTDSKTSLRSSLITSRREKSLQGRAATQEIRHIENALVEKAE